MSASRRNTRAASIALVRNPRPSPALRKPPGIDDPEMTDDDLDAAFAAFRVPPTPVRDPLFDPLWAQFRVDLAAVQAGVAA